MKKIIAIFLCAIIIVSLVSCGVDTTPSQQNAMKDYIDFCADLDNEQIVAVNTRLFTTPDGKKALVTDIKNNAVTGEAISNIEVAFAGWDVEGNPFALRTTENPNNSSNVLKGAIHNVTISGGEVWNADKGLFLDDTCKRIAYAVAIVFTCNIGETKWINPQYDAWMQFYKDLPLENWKMADMVNYQDGDTSAEEATADTSEPVQLEHTFESLFQNMLFQDIVAIKATANLQDDGRTALMANIRNASRKKVSEITVAFAMWDEAGNPIMIKCASGISPDSFVKEVDMGALVINGGTIWDANMGLVVENERSSISHVEAIVVSCKFKDTQWNNPLYSIWRSFFAGKQLDDTMLTTIVSYAQTIK